jgi:hypothetical protein
MPARLEAITAGKENHVEQWSDVAGASNSSSTRYAGSSIDCAVEGVVSPNAKGAFAFTFQCWHCTRKSIRHEKLDAPPALEEA